MEDANHDNEIIKPESEKSVVIGKTENVEVTNEKKVEQARTRINKKLFLEFFPQFRGVISTTARKVGISDDSVYQWREEDPEFAAAMAATTVNIKQKIRDVLLKKILIENDGPSVRYWLDRKDPEFMPKSKTEVYTGDRTLEDLLREDEDMLNLEVTVVQDGNTNSTTEKENKEGPERITGETIEHPGQEGEINKVQIQQGPTVLLEEKDKEKSDSKGATKGRVKSYRRGPAPRVHSERH